jgi:o-succinylbenzoate synthase
VGRGTSEVELRRLAMPLVEPFATAHGVQHARDVLLVRLRTADGDGWAECVAPDEPTYSSEHVDGAHAVLRDHLLPRWFAGHDLDEVKGHPMAKAALRTAELDLDLRRSGTSLAAHLGAARDRVPAGVAVGMGPGLLDEVERRVAEGYRRVKLKVAPGADVEQVAAVRERFPDLPLQVDANGSYAATADPLAALAPLDDFDLLLLEQPLADDDLLGHARLAGALRTPICLDESITSAATAETALALGAAEVINLKPGRVGGLAEAVRIHDLALARGLALWCGGMLETGLGRAVNVALAALPGFTLPGDLSASDRYFRVDITEPFVLEDGHLRVPDGPLAVDLATIEELTTRVEPIRG